MLLSPLAAPFQPLTTVQAMPIYNDGVPVMVGAEDEILHGIQDESIDEYFPPSAQEAAELEAVEVYVDLMATLSLLEEREERARESFGGFGKRWEARREDGLKGKPRLPKNLVSAVDHTNRMGKPLQTTDLVPFSHSNRELASALLESRRQQRQDFKRMNNKANKVSRAPPKPLQQPRKQFS